MTKAWMVAVREYTYNLRRPSFLFAAFGAPLIAVVAMILVTAIISSSQEDVDSVGQVGYVDAAGVLAEAVDRPAYFAPYASADAAAAALEAGEVGAYFVVAADYLETGNVQVISNRSVPGALDDTIDTYLIANLSRLVADQTLLGRIQDPVDLTVQIQDSGRVLDESMVFGLFLVPLIFALLFFMALQTTSTYLMASVSEEKSTRVMEIMVTSIAPLQLLLGKIIGLGALGLTQLIIWMGSGLLFLRLGQNTEALAGITLPPDLVILSLVYFVISYFLYAGIMAGVGVSAGSEQESRQIAGFVGLVAVVPFFFVNVFLTDPQSPLIIVLTMIPFTSPLTVLLRSSLGAVPAVEMIVSLLILSVSAALSVWMSARVFRWASLLYGKRATPRELWRVMRGVNETRIGTVASQHEEYSA